MSIQRINELIEKIQSEGPRSPAHLMGLYYQLYVDSRNSPTNSTKDTAEDSRAVGDLFVGDK